MAGRLLALVVFLLCVSSPRAALCDSLPRVLVLDTEQPVPPGFVDALRIQAAGVAEIVTGGEVKGTLPEKVKGVDAPLESQRASVGVWVEVSNELHLVYVVTRRRNRALVEVVRLPGGASPETDRALAIKVRDLLDSLFAGSGGEPEVVSTLRPERAEARPTPAPAPTPPPAPALSWSWLLQGGFAGVTRGNGSMDGQLGAALASGVRRGSRTWFLEGLAGVWFLSGTDDDFRGAAVRTRELELELSSRALFARERFALGLHLDAALRVLSAHGTASDGRTGEATSFIPLLRLGPEARFRASKNVDVRGAGGFDLALRRQRYSVVGEEVTDLGTMRGSFELGVVVALP